MQVICFPFFNKTNIDLAKQTKLLTADSKLNPASMFPKDTGQVVLGLREYLLKH